MDQNKIKDYMEWDKKYYIHTFMNEAGYEAIPVERTEGDKIITSYEGEYLDFNSQLVSTNVGNSNEMVNQRVAEAVNTYGFLWEKFLCNYRAEAVYKIIEKIPGMNEWAQRIKFYSSGSEGMEAALSLARLLTKRKKVLVKSIDFHGWTGNARNTTSIPYYGSMENIETGEMRSLERSKDFVTIPTPYCQDCPLGCRYEDCKANGCLHCVEETERIIQKENPDEIAACVTEIVSGFGAIVPPDEYIPQLTALLKKYGILWIDDEVLVGFGRLGKWFGYQYYKDVYPDIMCIGKGLTNSLVPCSGIVVSKELSTKLDQNIWFLGSTFSGHPVAMAAISATIDYMLENDVVEKSRKLSKMVEDSLRKLTDKYDDLLEKVSGRGMFWSIEFKGSKYEARKINIKGAFSPAQFVSQACYKRKLILGGLLPWTLRLTPSLNIKEEYITEGMKILDEALADLREYCRKNNSSLEEMVKSL